MSFPHIVGFSVLLQCVKAHFGWFVCNQIKILNGTES